MIPDGLVEERALEEHFAAEAERFADELWRARRYALARAEKRRAAEAREYVSRLLAVEAARPFGLQVHRPNDVAGPGQTSRLGSLSQRESVGRGIRYRSAVDEGSVPSKGNPTERNPQR